MLVPEMVLVAVSLVCHADVVPTPGANKSTQEPKLEKEARVSEESEAATVMAAGARAGLWLQALVLLLPAATTTVTLLATALATAASSAALMPPPRDMLMTFLLFCQRQRRTAAHQGRHMGRSHITRQGGVGHGLNVLLLLLAVPRPLTGTEGSATAQFRPATTLDIVPEPPQSSTRTATSVAPLATPNVLPPMVPATWVPWP
jgi:hypothetical protein